MQQFLITQHPPGGTNKSGIKANVAHSGFNLNPTTKLKLEVKKKKIVINNVNTIMASNVGQI